MDAHGIIYQVEKGVQGYAPLKMSQSMSWKGTDKENAPTVVNALETRCSNSWGFYGFNYWYHYLCSLEPHI